MTSPAFILVNRALAEDAIDLLLLGKPGYTYLPKWSPSPGNTDITALLAVFYDEQLGLSKVELGRRLQQAIMQIIDSYEGLFPVATVLLVESLARRDGRALGLPLEAIAERLKCAIEGFRTNLITDRIGGGGFWPDGALGDLRRLSKNVSEIGGPEFCS